MVVTYSGYLGGCYTSLGVQTLALKKHFSSFLFHLYFNKKYIEAAINDFMMHIYNYFKMAWKKKLLT